MRYKLALISTLLMGCCLIGCEKGILDSDNANGNAVIVKPANTTKADSGTSPIQVKVHPTGVIFTKRSSRKVLAGTR